uniref:Uncharacterized protein n=1 Tax=Cyclophora tenuis TaxID=216820 RepID=A0A7S1D1N4_CYCTE
MECMSVGYDHVVLSAPTAARSVMMEIQQLVQHLEVHPNVHVILTDKNNRYDVGLWCDALEFVQSKSPLRYKYITLVNDSVMVLRHTRVLLDRLETNRYDLVGMSYSHTGGSFWIESYVRGFSARGIEAFQEHSCRLAPSHESFSTKRSVVDYHEIGLINEYFVQEGNEKEGKCKRKCKLSLSAVGVYPGDLPKGWIGRGDANRTWVASFNLPYWKRALLKAHFFPLAKVKMPQMIRFSTKHYPECKLSPTTLESLPESLQYIGDEWSWKQVFSATTVSE